MARTPSSMPPLGITAPDFALPDPSGRVHRRAECRGPKGTLVMFLCNHCPFVKLVAEEIGRVAADAARLGVGSVGIMSNDFTTHPDDAPAHMTSAAKAWGWRFPYLVDEDQSVALAHRAACTPDFFLYDHADRLVYRGQLDDARPGNGVAPSGTDLRSAIAALAAGRPPLEPQKPSLGCNVKWRPGRAPA